jgi:dihydrofolate reductase
VGALNTKPKYVASNTLTDPKWSATTVVSGDVGAVIGELKAKPGGELQVHGSGTLVRWLLDNQLVDEITLLVCPVVVGQGTRLFPDNGRDMALDLVESRASLRASRSRSTGRPGARSMQSTEVRDDADRSHPRVPERPLKEIRAAVSDRGSSVRSRGERPPTRGPNDRR